MSTWSSYSESPNITPQISLQSHKFFFYKWMVKLTKPLTEATFFNLQLPQNAHIIPKLCKSANPQSSHCKPLFLDLPRFLSNKNQVHRKTSAANPQLWWSGWVYLLQKSQDELLETTSYFESSCADWQYIDLIMRLLQEGNLWNPNSCGVRTAFQRTSLWSWIVEVESGGGHPWRSPHRISLLLVPNSIFQLNC